MSDNEDLLGDDLGDHSLADYNLGNEEEEQLLADDYDSGDPQNVPSSIGTAFNGSNDMVCTEYSSSSIEYTSQPIPYQPAETECVVPNITVEVPNTPLREQSYIPYNETPHPVYEAELAVVPPAIPAAPPESPQIVPSEVTASLPKGGGRERFVNERAAPRAARRRDIPDTLDKVVVPRAGWGGRGAWRASYARYSHPYRRNNMHRGNFNLRASFPPPQQITPPQIRPEIQLEIRPDILPEIGPEIRPELRPEPPLQPARAPSMLPLPSQMGPEVSPERPILPEEIPNVPFRPQLEPQPPFNPSFHAPRFPNQQFRPSLEEPRPIFRPSFEPRPNFEPRPSFEPRPMFHQRPFTPPRPFAQPIREIVPNNVSHMPQVTIRQALPGMPLPPNAPKMEEFIPGREQEVRMLPVQLPPNLPPGGLAGKKVLINPHFKGTFQPPVEGTIKDIDDAAERFIAEQRNALARAASRKFTRRSPQRFIENTTIEIENDLARGTRRADDDELLRRQEEFINANRAGLRRRMRSPSPPREAREAPARGLRGEGRPREEGRPRRSGSRSRSRSASPARAEAEYRRRLRDQQALRDRVLRAKELRRRRAAVAAADREQDRQDKENKQIKPNDTKPMDTDKDSDSKPTSTEDNKPDTTKKSPEKETVKEKERPTMNESRDDTAEVNSTCENLTPPRETLPVTKTSPERDLTPPLPDMLKRDDRGVTGLTGDSDVELDLILDDIDGILSDDDDTGRFKDKGKLPTSSPPAPADLRSRLPPRATKPPARPRDETQRLAAVSSSSNSSRTQTNTKSEAEVTTTKQRQRITFDSKDKKPEKEKEKEAKPKSFSNRRVILQRKVTQTTKDKSIFSRIEAKSDPSKPNPGIFSRAVRTAIGNDKRIVVKKTEDPQVEYESGSDDDGKKVVEESGLIAMVTNLPHGMTDTRMKTLAGDDVQSLTMDKNERTAKIVFKSSAAADRFKRKFNNKMVAASRLAVTLR